MGSFLLVFKIAIFILRKIPINECQLIHAEKTCDLLQTDAIFVFTFSLSCENDFRFYDFFFCFDFRFYGLVNSVKVMSTRSVNIYTLFLRRLPKRLTST